jgi:hypothetical protein
MKNVRIRVAHSRLFTDRSKCPDVQRPASDEDAIGYLRTR